VQGVLTEKREDKITLYIKSNWMHNIDNIQTEKCEACSKTIAKEVKKKKQDREKSYQRRKGMA
jgi:hypothetical protein